MPLPALRLSDDATTLVVFILGCISSRFPYGVETSVGMPVSVAAGWPTSGVRPGTVGMPGRTRVTIWSLRSSVPRRTTQLSRNHGVRPNLEALALTLTHNCRPVLNRSSLPACVVPWQRRTGLRSGQRRRAARRATGALPALNKPRSRMRRRNFPLVERTATREGTALSVPGRCAPSLPE